MELSFLTSKNIAEGIEGMLSPFSMAAMDSVLAFQATAGIHGDMTELGVFRGKSAAILAGRLATEEQLHLFDIEDYFDRPALEGIGARLSFNVGSTLDLRRRRFARGGTRFCHIDASHQFEPTLHELALADYMLSPQGVVCLDDYTNLNYSQILAATFKYLFTRRTDLTMFMVTNEKAYLCRRKMFPIYAEFVLHRAISEMAKRGIDDVCIARTDDTPSYGAFYLRPKEPGETDDLYGKAIYQQFYEIKRHSPVIGAAAVVARKLRRFFG